MFESVSAKKNYSQMEEKILQFWEKNKIFEKSLEQRKNSKNYTFYDGPPFATGTPHYGHIVASVMKDVVPRYWTMRGYYVERKWGWDCHGLPIENIVEKKMGNQKKKDIEKMGVEIFNEKCRSQVLTYVDEWKKVIRRVGRWADMENAYRTMDLKYMESVWWVFKELWDKGLIYKDYRSMYICPRCETTLSQSEVTEGYKNIKDFSVTVKFKLEKGQEIKGEKIKGNVYILAWTTTPWTLPGNVALAVGKDIDYILVKDEYLPADITPLKENENPKTAKFETKYYILAKNKLEKYKIYFHSEAKIIKEFKGLELIGKKYQPLFSYYAKDKKLKNRENGWKIYTADFVTIEDGTGVVHIAPAFGEDDLKLGQEKKLPFIQHVGMDGIIKKEATDFAGLSVKPMTGEKNSYQKTDIEMIKYLAAKNLLLAKEKYEHSYPHCWRCGTPLINYATSSWFVAVNKKIEELGNKSLKQKALELAKEINWSPENMKEGRFGNWLKGARDWSISRQRFWASVIPIWVCDKCGEKKVFGSVKEINKKLGSFFIMRHGEAESNTKDIISCQPGDGLYLTEKGKMDVTQTAEKLKKENIELIISSDLDRTKQTAEIVSQKTGAPIIFDKRLREAKAGISNGKKLSDLKIIREKWKKGINAKFPQGDDFVSIKERLIPFYNEIFRKYQAKRILIISHGAILMSLEAMLSGKDYLAEMKNIFLHRIFKRAEVRKLNYKLLDLHKHIVDKVTFKCEKCGGTMKRVPDVLDTWFDSGSMPYAQKHYPFENKEKFEKTFPADFIAEGVDQTRAWFYYLHLIATGIKKSPAFKNVIVNGIVLAEDGKKMSKKLQNYPDPMKMFDKYGADAVRFYLMSSPVVVAQNISFIEKEVAQITRGMMRMLWNSYSFFVLYANIDKFSPDKNFQPKQLKNLLDKWIISELHTLIKKFNQEMESYKLHKASRLFPKFIDELSNWYIRRSRKRFWKSENDTDKKEAYATLHYVLVTLSKVMAPFTPFVAEEIYKNLTGEESVHLQNFPQADEILIDEKLNTEMKMAREIVTVGLQLRAQAKIKVRQPLQKLEIKNCKLNKEFSDIIKEEMNVKEVIFQQQKQQGKISPLDIFLDTYITPELKLEGQAREIIRAIQQMRKEAGYEVDNRIIISYNSQLKVFEKFGDLIAKETLANEIKEGKIDNPDLQKEFEIEGQKIILEIARK